MVQSAMKKKRLILIFGAAILASAAAILFFPYPRQLVIGPKYHGVPLCAWQAKFREQTTVVVFPEDHQNTFTRLMQWFTQGRAVLEWSSLSWRDREAIFISLADDKDPAVRKAIIIYLFRGVPP